MKMSTAQLKKMVDSINADGEGKFHITVDSPACYSQWRMITRIAPGVSMLGWMDVSDPPETFKDVTLVGEAK
jgi:hypothetical protein